MKKFSVLVIVVLLFTFGASNSEAQEFNVGDRVSFEKFGKTVEGFVESKGDKLYSIRYQERNQERSRGLAPAKLKLIESAPVDSPFHEFKAGDQISFKWRNKTCEGTIDKMIGASGNLALVKFKIDGHETITQAKVSDMWIGGAKDPATPKPVDSSKPREFKTGDRVSVLEGATKKEGVIVGPSPLPDHLTVEYKFHGHPAMTFPVKISKLTLLEQKPTVPEELPKLEFRQWTDATGKFSVMAKLVSFENGTVNLEKQEGGKPLSLPLAKLSKPDQKWLEDREALAQTIASKPVTVTELVKVPLRTDFLEIGVASESVQIGSLPAASKRKKLTFPDFRGRAIEKFVLSPNQKWLAARVAKRNRSDSDLFLVDLESQSKVAGQVITVPVAESEALAVSPSGKTIATIVKEFHTGVTRLDFWTIENGKAVSHRGWETDRSFSPEKAFFVDDSKFMCHHRDSPNRSDLTLWDLETISPIYSYQVKGDVQPIHRKNLVAFCTPGAYHFIEIETGEIAGTIRANSHDIEIAVSDDGRQMVVRGGISYAIFDLKTGEQSAEFGLPKNLGLGMHWTDSKNLLIGSTVRHLVSTELRAPIWRYLAQGTEFFKVADGQFLVATSKGVNFVTLPQKDVSSNVEKFVKDSKQVFGPTAPVRLDVDLPFSGAINNQIRSKVTEDLKAKNISLDENSDVVLKLWVKTREPKKRNFGVKVGRKTEFKDISYEANVCIAEISKGDKSLWRDSRLFNVLPTYFTLPDFDAIEAAIKEDCQPRHEHFLDLDLPKSIYDMKGDVWGTSTLDETGVKFVQ